MTGLFRAAFVFGLLLAWCTPGARAQADNGVNEVAEEPRTPETAAPASAPDAADAADAVAAAETAAVSVYVIPVTEAIDKANLFIVRRGVKEAIQNEIDMILLDVNTPGGGLFFTLEIMEMLDRFEGITATYVNDEAISAGALIASSTQEIYFHPKGRIGAAAVVAGSGQEIPETMANKLNSYMNAVVRSMNEDHPYRGQVVRAMMEADFELVIDDEPIGAEGQLLTLTASEAMRTFGDPPTPLFGDGIYKDIDALLSARFGADRYQIRDFEITYSEKFAKWMGKIAPGLLGLGMLLLFIEFKTPSFGVLGGIGIALIVVFFISNYIAGLAGKEAIVLFILGVLLVIAEIIFLPGSLILFIPGFLMVLGGLIWAMVDVWPKDGGGITVEMSSVVDAFSTAVFGMTFAIVGLAILWAFLPKSWLLERIVHQGRSAAPDPVVAGGGRFGGDARALPAIGAVGSVVTPLHPGGQIDIDGSRYEAVVQTGTLDRGESVVVVGHRNFALLVNRKGSA